MRIGIDIGGVLIGPSSSAEDKDTNFFSDNYLKTPAVDGAFSAITKLVNILGTDKIYLVSKAAPSTQVKTLEWFDDRKFYDKTGFAAHNIRFCLKRHDKAAVARELKLAAFVDDKCEVLSYLRGIVPRRIAFCSLDAKEYSDVGILHVDSWDDAVVRLCAPLHEGVGLKGGTE